MLFVVDLPDELPAELADDGLGRRRRHLLLGDLEMLIATVDALPEDVVEGLVAEAALDQHDAVVDRVDVLLVVAPGNADDSEVVSSKLTLTNQM